MPIDNDPKRPRTNLALEQRSFELRLPALTWRRLENLVEGADHLDSVDDLLRDLLNHVQQGVYRSGAWERRWLEQCFGPEAVDKAYELDPDPL